VHLKERPSQPDLLRLSKPALPNIQLIAAGH